MNFIRRMATALIIAAISPTGYASAPEKAITMTTAMEGIAELLMAGKGTATINWGDGSALEKVRFKRTHKWCRHAFPDTTARTIVIKGQNITFLQCFRMELTALDVTKNTALATLRCDNNRLTSLDVTQNTALRDLFCGSNELTAGGLNALFGTLNDIAGRKEIRICKNPGTDGCNRGIADNKGWEVK